MKEVVVAQLTPASREYFCKDCRQLRLAPGGSVRKCGNCGSASIVIAAVGALDKKAEIAHLWAR